MKKLQLRLRLFPPPFFFLETIFVLCRTASKNICRSERQDRGVAFWCMRGCVPVLCSLRGQALRTSLRPRGTSGTKRRAGPAPIGGPRGARSWQPLRTSICPTGTPGPAPTAGPRGARRMQHMSTCVRPRGTLGPAPTAGPRGARSLQPWCTYLRPRDTPEPEPT